ncbi:MAG: hypothetical protein P1U56_10990 [Saprospiraceae bacterium]|nr:hypothetical protein [Saprospiraceae bacterium]
MAFLSNIYNGHVKDSARGIFKVQNIAKATTIVDDMGLESFTVPQPYSTAIQLCKIVSGVPQEGAIYRKIYFDENGNVIKKLFFDKDGGLERKEVYKFDNDQIVSSTFITDSELQIERYYMKENPNHETEYDFFNPEKAEIKSEYYTFDSAGRKQTKTSIGYGGLEELYTKYLYVGSSKIYSFREVYSSNPNNNGKILLTLVYNRNKSGKLNSLMGFQHKTKNNIASLKSFAAKKEACDFLTEWEYDKNGNQLSMISSEKPPSILNNPVIQNSEFLREFGYAESEDFGYQKGDSPVIFRSSRIITVKTTFEYNLIDGEDDPRLHKVIDWLPRYDEPFKDIKKYTYYDNDGTELKWV